MPHGQKPPPAPSHPRPGLCRQVVNVNNALWRQFPGRGQCRIPSITDNNAVKLHIRPSDPAADEAGGTERQPDLPGHQPQDETVQEEEYEVRGVDRNSAETFSIVLDGLHLAAQRTERIHRSAGLECLPDEMRPLGAAKRRVARIIRADVEDVHDTLLRQRLLKIPLTRPRSIARNCNHPLIVIRSPIGLYYITIPRPSSSEGMTTSCAQPVFRLPTIRPARGSATARLRRQSP